jgi:hypothetical protein
VIATDVQVGDQVELRKGHPCGTNAWVVRRIGADIGLTCQGCGRRVMLTRREFGRRLKRYIARAAPDPHQDP